MEELLDAPFSVRSRLTSRKVGDCSLFLLWLLLLLLMFLPVFKTV
jgi:hypothetical protein